MEGWVGVGAGWGGGEVVVFLGFLLGGIGGEVGAEGGGEGVVVGGAGVLFV